MTFSGVLYIARRHQPTAPQRRPRSQSPALGDLLGDQAPKRWPLQGDPAPRRGSLLVDPAPTRGGLLQTAPQTVAVMKKNWAPRGGLGAVLLKSR